ncbi:MAG TPA: RNA 3'-terminal phosphate cyclase, partial [Blastocatellia bacterium]|nr:RNA 3'-terminal phosphate cyclase [Blastocatellia bacterium]
WPRELLEAESVENSPGPGNIIIIEMESQNVTEVITGFGQRGKAAETVADEAAKAARRYLAADVPVGEYLADQLLVPLAVAGGGSFLTLALSRHSTTNIEVIHKFLDARINVHAVDGRKWLVEINA